MHLFQGVQDARRGFGRIRVGCHNAHDRARFGSQTGCNDPQHNVLGLKKIFFVSFSLVFHPFKREVLHVLTVNMPASAP